MKTTSISDITLERYILGELPADKLQNIEQIAAQDTSLQKRIENLRASNDEILSMYTPEYVAPLIRSKAPSIKIKRHKRILFKLVPVFSAGAVLAVILFALPTPLTHSPVTITKPLIQNDTRFKGDAGTIHIFRKTINGAEPVLPESIAQNGDELQLSYQSSRAYGIIFSIDGRGNVTLHYPDTEFVGTAIRKNEKIILPHAYQLDDAPEFERFFFVTSDIAVNTGYVLSKARNLAKNIEAARNGSLNIAGTKEYAVTIRKGDTR